MALDAEITALQQIPIFQGADPGSVRLLACLSDRVYIEEGEFLCHRGDPSDCVFIVLSGRVDFVLDGPSGRILLGEEGAGAVVGEVGILCDTPRSASVLAVTDIELLRLSRESFFRLMSDNPRFSLAVARELAHRLHRTVSSR